MEKMSLEIAGTNSAHFCS